MKFLFYLFFSLHTVLSFAQASAPIYLTSHELKSMGHSINEPFKVIKLASDSNSTSNLVIIKKSLNTHYHLNHTENIWVISGKAKMLVGKQVKNIKKGDYIQLPPGTLHNVKVTSKEALQVISIQSPQFDGKDRIFVDENK